uniref:Uncharacterized protein n=1 Tax=Candidatus Kentrum sp. MB TaxID=2138164 RepID=A0A450X3H9_9GAMM|nr:MAG: hypothetical protein BECKMB1821G_GA0114241_100618 [Candidatus Kentron sp. MB]VFK26692.1 MAG: hypothetical protein BECKMB1821I_GA0114274_100191 [Candidatus Kentron sp. MB]VFK74599.1 MAG: hypothetical protein BECKMB1821H_GA0114242_100718 [Candidatus Kentron sp. MB]
MSLIVPYFSIISRQNHLPPQHHFMLEKTMLASILAENVMIWGLIVEIRVEIRFDIGRKSSMWRKV